MVSKKIPTWPCRKAGNTKSTVNLIDYEGVRTVIDGISNKLFRQDGTVELLICRWSEKEKLRPTPIFSYDELDSYLLIDQEHTKSSLDITKDGLNLLLDRLDAFPHLGPALPAFAASDIPVHEGKTAFNARCSISTAGNPSFELCILLKYVEPNGNKSDPIPYSVRQELLYQNLDAERKLEAVVLFRASTTLKRRITDEFHGRSDYPGHWTNVPVLAVSTLSSHWAEYCKFLDEGIWKIDKSSTHTNPFLPSLGEANFNTLQATQKYHDLLTRAVHVLQNNIRVLSSLSRESKKRKTLENDMISVSLEYYTVLDAAIEDAKEDLEAFIKHLELIQARLSRITEGIRDSIALRSSHHAAVETQNMRALTTQSIREARTVKAIALVTLIYLPATFVATFLGMNTLEVKNQSRGRLNVAVDPELWIYLALTIPLTLCTLAAWWGWEWWSRRNQKESVGVSWKADGGEV
ncbi:hypothetical protein K505DRAFT_350626 [Melanomma pulvis-pyrius CBS 109.77]|uniref:Cora-domain-containing protein n=1 Tax=Melanomma pulvis-pyrius CBS 109.77 TaxID=1314802 RepID=A0A6A6X7V0_9PLEO|nr:hypothetical protein K505DRAFT_350626 [Melanomma pulvis-pyrius CBS 109.77]